MGDATQNHFAYENHKFNPFPIAFSLQRFVNVYLLFRLKSLNPVF